MARSILIDLNPIELNYYPFMISLDKCNGGCNAVNDLSRKIWIPSETKGVNVEVFNMIARINENANNLKCKLNSITCNSNQIWNNDTCQWECKKYPACKNDYSWNPSTCICENGKYLKTIADSSVMVRDKIINAKDSVSTNVTSTIPTNMTNTMSRVLRQ